MVGHNHEYRNLSSCIRFALDRADELNGKHTLFGRCMGDTIFSEYRYPLKVYGVIVKLYPIRRDEDWKHG